MPTSAPYSTSHQGTKVDHRPNIKTYDFLPLPVYLNGVRPLLVHLPGMPLRIRAGGRVLRLVLVFLPLSPLSFRFRLTLRGFAAHKKLPEPSTASSNDFVKAPNFGTEPEHRGS